MYDKLFVSLVSSIGIILIALGVALIVAVTKDWW